MAESDALVALLAKLLAPHLEPHLGRRADAAPVYYDQSDSPLGKRLHLELVRRGVLTGHKSGRRVLIRCDDVHAHIEACKPARNELKSSVDDPLDDWGLQRAERH